MKLPLDIFQLLGVGPSADRRNILTILEKRLNEVNFKGFSEKTLKKRKEILTRMSKVLLEPEKRRFYEESYIEASPEGVENYYEIAQGDEIAGLLILLEAGQAQESIEIGEKLYGEWKSSVGVQSSSCQELMLVIDHAVVEYAKDLRAKRYYESATEILRKRLRPVENQIMKEMQSQIKQHIENLLPFEILDLVSRNSSEKQHEKGKRLLEKMIRDRGGLEKDSSKYMSNDEFRLFFRQIRKFLTVQEQIDMFQKWSLESSPVAGFLTGIALVASGFAQRKPERLVEALEILNQIETTDLELVKANIYLLLGDVEKANNLLTRYADVELDAWCKETSESRLAQQCAWCKEWLARDVLLGYRDLEADPDLEAYFCDRDVINYIESYDHISRKLSTEVRIGTVSKVNMHRNGSNIGEEKLVNDYLGEVKERLEKVKGRLMGQGEIQRKRAITTIAMITGIIAMLLGYMGIMHRAELERPKQTKGKGVIHKKIEVPDKTWGDKNRERSQDTRKKVEYNTKELNDILSTWLTVKKVALEGRPIPKSASKVASLGAIRRLESERNSNERNGEQQKTKVAVKEIVILSSKASQIEIEATLDYEDIKYNRSGEQIARTPRHIFKRKYVLIKEKDRWLIE